MSEGGINAIDHLLEIINQYQIEDVNPQNKTLMNLKGFLDANGILDEREKLDVYKSLFRLMEGCRTSIIGMMTLRQEKKSMIV